MLFLPQVLEYFSNLQLKSQARPVSEFGFEDAIASKR